MLKLLILSLSIYALDGVKIVILAPDISNSQIIVNKRVAETLADAGHDVTIALIQYFDGRNYKETIKIDNRVKIYTVNASVGITIQDFEAKQGEVIFEDHPIFSAKNRDRIGFLMGNLKKGCRATLQNKEFLQWLKAEKFDVAFTHMYQACPVGLVKIGEIPAWIWLNSGMLMDYVADLVGVPTVPSYVPPIAMEATDEMTFYERCKSFIGHTLFKFWPVMVKYSEDVMFKEEIDENFPSLIDLARECPLVMVNTNDLYALPRPSLAKVINIGGIGMKFNDAKPLTGDYAKIADVAKKGIVVFSFGSVAPAHKMPDSWKQAFMDAFREFADYQFIMRYEKDDLKGKLPPNVHQFKWLPQTDLLQHSKIRVFIIHAGYNSIQEGISAGVPMITIALFGDQFKNAMMAKKHRIALAISKSLITKESIVRALKTITENDSYYRKAKRMSAMVQKQPISPETLLVKWTKFLAEFKTLENLVPAGQKLNFIQYHSIDVIAFLSLIIFIVLFVIWKLLKSLLICIIRCFRRPKSKVE